MYFFTEWLQFLKKFLIFLLCLKMAMAESGHFLGEWALEVDGGDEVALAIAQKHNFEYLGKIFDNVHHFRHRRLAKRSTKPSGHHQSLLRKEPAVRWAEQQVVKRRVKRDFNSIYKLPRHRVPERSNIDKSKNSAHISDPKWEMMWYLNRGGGLDMNVQSAWKNNVTGKGVVVTILDDGLEKDHPDLIQNYDPHASTDVNGRDSDPMPRYDLLDSNRHGTRCAGEVAAKVNNSVCAVGVAYEASVGGVRMLDGDVTDAVEARSLSFNTQHIDIYSASWGPDDDGKTVDGPGKLATRAFNDGVITGRNGKGSIFVWASGNGGRDQDNCNCDGYTNSIWTLSISSATEQGSVPWYSEACSSTLATTYSSGSVGERQIITTDLHHGCTTTHTGTSASAPLAAGICALALQANKKLTWRDMQHVVVRTARPENLIAPDWQINGVGRKVSHRFGYGLMDANGMVKLARNWTTVPPQRGCEVPSAHVNKVIPHQSSETLSLEVSDCPGVNYLEHVQAKVTLTADRRGDIEIFLISPSGTKSNLLALRQRDNSRNGFHLWPFMTVHMWGESPLGIWKLEIRNSGIFYSNSVVATRLSEWSLVFYGTRTDPDSKATGKRRSSHNDSYDFPKVFSRYPVQPTRPPRPNVLPPFSFDPNGIYPFGALRTTPDNMMTPRPPFDYNRKVHSNFNYGGFPPFLNISKFPVINTFKPSRRPPARPRFNWPYFPLMTSPRTTPKPYRKPLLRDHNGNAQIQNWTLLFHGTEYEPGASVNSDVNHFGKPGVNMIDGNAIEHSSLSPHVTERAKGEVDFGHKDEASRSSSAPRSRPGSEVLGCVGLKNSSGDCLECAASFILHEGRCVRSCPLKFYVGKSSTPSSELVCLPCHYSCKTCTGPFDYECVTCWPDALSYAPRKGEQYCRSKSLLEAYNHQSSLLKLVIPLFLLLFFFVLILSFVVFRRTPNRDSPYTFPEDARGSVLKLRPGVPLASTTNSYSPLRIDDRDKLVAGRTFHDHSSEDEIG